MTLKGPNTQKIHKTNNREKERKQVCSVCERHHPCIHPLEEASSSSVVSTVEVTLECHRKRLETIVLIILSATLQSPRRHTRFDLTFDLDVSSTFGVNFKILRHLVLEKLMFPRQPTRSHPPAGHNTSPLLQLMVNARCSTAASLRQTFPLAFHLRSLCLFSTTRSHRRVRLRNLTSLHLNLLV